MKWDRREGCVNRRHALVVTAASKHKLSSAQPPDSSHIDGPPRFASMLQDVPGLARGLELELELGPGPGLEVGLVEQKAEPKTAIDVGQSQGNPGRCLGGC